MSVIDLTPYRDRPILVTGADGFIGSHLVEALLGAGAQVTALAYYEAFGHLGWLGDIPPHPALHIQRGDVRDPGQMGRLVRGHDVVFHLAALIGIPYSFAAAHSYVQTNLEGTLNLLEACRANPVSRFVHTSTSEVYGTAQTQPMTEDHPLQGQSPYSASKIAADMMAEAYFRSHNVPVAILRPFNTFGPRQSERAVIPTVIRQALDPSCEAIRVGDLTPSRDFTFVTDTVAAFLAMGIAKEVAFGRPYNAGTGQGVTIRQMLEMVLKITGSTKPVIEEMVRKRPAASEVRALLADSSAITAATGWSPSQDLEQGLSFTVTWWRERIATGTTRANADYLV